VANFIQNLFNGVTIGMVYFLIAAGMSIVLGIMGITNLAHGAIFMIGAYAGWTIERGFLRVLYKQVNEQVLVTFGFVLILGNAVIWIWGGRFRMQYTAPGLMGAVEIGGISFAKTRIFILVVGLILGVILWWVQDRTRVGAMVRAGMDDKEMIMGLGVNLPVVSALVFFLATFLAGFAGVMGSSIIGPNPGMGLDMLLLALIVTIVGGIGSIQGALLGGILIGVLDTFGKVLFPQFGLFTMYLAMVIILLIRPSGLLGRRIR
jgi:branched-chain amino acid transport system permease protein